MNLSDGFKTCAEFIFIVVNARFLTGNFKGNFGGAYLTLVEFLLGG